MTFYYQDPATCNINGDLTVREVVFQLCLLYTSFPYLLNAPGMEKINPEQLAQPVITWSGKTVGWREIANAQGYAVVLTKNGKTVDERTVTQTSVDYTTEIDLAGSGTYTCLLYTSRCV